MTVLLNDSMLHLAPYAVGFLIFLLVTAWQRKRSVSYLLCAFVFGIYLLLAADKTFFPLTPISLLVWFCE